MGRKKKCRDPEEVRMKEVHCPFCGSILTLLLTHRNNLIKFSCLDCRSTSFLYRARYTTENLDRMKRLARNYFGRDYRDLLEKAETRYKGTLRCPFCFWEIDDFKLTRNRRFYYWRCKNCAAHGFVTDGVVARWKFLSGLVAAQEAIAHER